MARRRRDRADIHSFTSQGDTGRYVDRRGDFQTSFSTLERDAARRLEYENDVRGMSSQLYLDPLEEVEEIAKQLGVRAPDHKNGKRLSTDIRVNVTRPSGTHGIAVYVKYSNDLNKRRVREKRDIEREFWKRRGVEFRVETEQTLKREFRRNLQHADVCALALDALELGSGATRILADLESLMEQNPLAMLGQITDLVDDERSLEPGLAMTVLWAAIWRGRLAADLFKPIRPSSRALMLWPIEAR